MTRKILINKNNDMFGEKQSANEFNNLFVNIDPNLAADDIPTVTISFESYVQ